MNYLAVGGPDKLSIGAFLKFIKPRLGNAYIYGDMHSLMSEDAKNSFINDFCSRYNKGVFSYYARKAVNVDPMICLPKRLIEIADVVGWFDLYSTELKVLKETTPGEFSTTIGEWKQYIQKLS